MYALSVCEDERLKLAINLSFSCSLRLGELLGLTWDCVDISPEAIEENRAYVFINKESQRIRKESLNALDGKDVLLVFPTNHKKNSTVRILKTPKTESSVRKIFLPKSVANMLVDWKAEQDERKSEEDLRVIHDNHKAGCENKLHPAYHLLEKRKLL